MRNTAADVLIVGAGPTGLTLACALAQRGVRLRIVDASSAPATGSRGKGLQPRSLELFDDLGIAAEVLAHGVFDLPIRYYDESGHSKDQGLYEQAAPRPDAPFLRPLIIPQWRVEEALRHKLEQLGTRVEFGAELTDISQHPDGVTATLAGAAPTSLDIRYLVGCDGGKSTVRRLTGIAFLGETLEAYRMLVGDVRVDGVSRDRWHIWKSTEGCLALCPLPSTDAFQLQASIAPGQESEPSLEVFQSLTERRTGNRNIRVSEPTWMSLWRANVRMVDRYRQDRVFLAGDSAHVHSPAGGQGMNTGIQDAYNLGWKLAAVLNGAGETLLDTYQSERLPIAAGVLGISNEIMAATVAAGAILIRRDERTLQLDLNYRHSNLSHDTRPQGDGLRAGDRAPDAPELIGPDGDTRRMFDLLRGPHITFVGFGARWQPIIQECVALLGNALRGYVIVPSSNAADADTGPSLPAHPILYADPQGHARNRYGDDSLFVIRPDNYIGMATSDLVSAPIIEYLRAICAPT